MIPKGNQRGGGQQLATHLLNSIDNERMEVLELRGSIADDLHGAFAEWRATAAGTKCKKYLYSLSINPDPKQRPLSREEFRDFIARTEKALGLDDQPRAIVSHTKNGREHCHVVWSRIDTEKMKAVHLSHDRQDLRTVARDFARDHGLELPHGMKKDRGKKRFEDRKKQSSHHERQQEERTGISKQQRQREITETWTQAADGKALQKGLEQRGYTLAQGSQRSYVVIDRYGEVHALARQIQGANARDVRDRLKDIPLETLPTVEQARKQAAQKAKNLREKFILENDPRKHKMEKAHEKKRVALEQKKAALRERHQKQRERLLARIEEANKKREASKARVLRALWARLTGQQAGITPGQKRSLEAQLRRHRRQMRNIARQERALKSLQKRETRSLETIIRREARQRDRKPPAKEHIRAAREFLEKARQKKEPEKTPERVPVKTPEKETALPFREAAEKPQKQYSKEFLKALQSRAAEKKEKRDKGREPS